MGMAVEEVRDHEITTKVIRALRHGQARRAHLTFQS